jgi:hypothetical protein
MLYWVFFLFWLWWFFGWSGVPCFLWFGWKGEFGMEISAMCIELVFAVIDPVFWCVFWPVNGVGLPWVFLDEPIVLVECYLVKDLIVGILVMGVLCQTVHVSVINMWGWFWVSVVFSLVEFGCRLSGISVLDHLLSSWVYMCNIRLVSSIFKKKV